MTAKELLGILTSRLTYESAGDWDIVDEFTPRRPRIEFIRDENEIQNAILQSLKAKGELETLYKEITSNQTLSESLPQSVLKKIYRILYPTPKAPSKKNESITTLVKYFCDKKSKKVVYAREDLRFRYYSQNYSDQKKILHTFLLHGTREDRKWAAKQLYENWDKSFASELRSVWEMYHEPSVGYTLLKYIDKSYCVSQIEQLQEAGIDDKYIFATLGNEPGFPFEINLGALNAFDYFYVMAKLGRNVDENEARNILIEKLYLGAHILATGSEEGESLIYGPVPDSLTSFRGIDSLIWSFGKLGLTDTLLEVFSIAQQTHNIYSKDNHQYARNLLDVLKPYHDNNNDDEPSSGAYIRTEEGVTPLDLDDPSIPENIRSFIKDFQEGLDAD